MRLSTIDERNKVWTWAVIAAVLLCLGAVLSSCAGAPKSPQQFEEMSEEDFQAWLTRVSVWAQLAADQVARSHPEDVERILLYASLVETLPGDPDPLGHAAGVAGLTSPIVAVLVLEARALLDAKGALPEGRVSEFLEAVARGVRLGAEPYLVLDAGTEFGKLRL